MKVKQKISLLLLAMAIFGIIGATAVEAGNYNRNVAAQYAIDNADKKVPNSDFYFTRGGDCTNFVSNALQKDGWTETGKYLYDYDKAWYFDWSIRPGYSYTWGGANNFYKFPYYSSRVLWVSGPSQLQKGDIVQIDGASGDAPNDVWDHTMMVTGKDSSGLLVSYHSGGLAGSGKNVALNGIMAKLPNARYVAWHVKDTY